ncbi:MAG: efflux RND transporter periplasmic adaptor subunit [candidate division Zixibacteria bacterium]|nr:efflux RND transporter periplasmic adaptor subunit [candidate division Zixibacteria bacterium]
MKGSKKRYKKNAFLLLCGALVIALLAAGGLLFTQNLQSDEEKGKDGDTAIESSSHTGSGKDSHSVHTDRTQEEKRGGKSENVIKLAPEVAVLSDIQTEPVQYRRLVKEIQTVGEIAYDERRVKVVSAWIGGRIDRLYVDFTGIDVKEGDPLAELYSPELVSTQQEYLLALETREMMRSGGNEEAIKSANDLLNATRLRLFLWGISEQQIDQMEKTWRVNPRMNIHAPIGGTVIHKRVNEGQYVKTGEALYTIADLAVVWALVDIYEYEMAWVRRGQRVSVTTPAYPGMPFTGTVSFIDPFLDTKTRTVKVRMDVPNPQLVLKPGMYVEARLKIPLKNQKPVLSIPYTAVLDTGVRKVAYVEVGEGEYKPVEVQVGPRAGDYVPVLSGLKKGQRVVVSANYLLDSQSTLGAGASGEFGGALGGGHKH